VNLENVTRDDWIVGGLAVVLAIFLLVLPWFHLSVTVGPFTASADFSATDDPDGWLAIIAVIASLAVVVDLAIERLSPETEVPAISGSRTNTRFVLVAIAAAFVFLKFLFHIHFNDFGWGFYVIVIVTAALVYFAYQAHASGSIAFGGPSGGSRRGAPPPPPPGAAPPSDQTRTPPSGTTGRRGPGGRSTPPPAS
jgi:hypothetical protein